jgi:hypothetical protein
VRDRALVDDYAIPFQDIVTAALTHDRNDDQTDNDGNDDGGLGHP